MRMLDLIIIHCSASPNGRPHTVEDIDRWHRERGFARIGYHKVIYIDGTVHEGRPIDMTGAHAEGYNARSIGICLIGTDKFTQAQWDALELLIGTLQNDYRILRVVGHGEIPGVHKDCPGFSVKEWKNERKALDGHVLKM